jgi:hypothetical protein
MHLADRRGGHRPATGAVGLVHRLVGPGPGPVADAGPQRRLASADALPAGAALAAGGPHAGIQGVEGGDVDLVDLGPAEGRDDVAVDGALVVGNRDGRDRPDLLAPLEPALDQLRDCAGAAATLLAPVELLQELRFDLLGLAVGRLGLPADLAAEPSLAAGEGVAAGEHLDLQAAAALPDHPASNLGCHSILGQKNDIGMTSGQARQVVQACDLRLWELAGGLEPPTCCLHDSCAAGCATPAGLLIKGT